MQNPLTPDQQARLKKASSGLTTENFSKLSLAETNKVANRINQVLLQLHQESPFAFITTPTSRTIVLSTFVQGILHPMI